jgi:hypothetical protein
MTRDRPGWASHRDGQLNRLPRYRRRTTWQACPRNAPPRARSTPSASRTGGAHCQLFSFFDSLEKLRFPRIEG